MIKGSMCALWLALVTTACTADDVDDAVDGAEETSGTPVEPATSSGSTDAEPESGSSEPDTPPTSTTSADDADDGPANEDAGLPVDVACGSDVCELGTVCVAGGGTCECGPSESESGGSGASYVPAEPACEAVPDVCSALLGDALAQCFVEELCRIGASDRFPTANVYEEGTVVCAADGSDTADHCGLETC